MGFALVVAHHLAQAAVGVVELPNAFVETVFVQAFFLKVAIGVVVVGRILQHAVHPVFLAAQVAVKIVVGNRAVQRVVEVIFGGLAGAIGIVEVPASVFSAIFQQTALSELAVVVIIFYRLGYQ